MSLNNLNFRFPIRYLTFNVFNKHLDRIDLFLHFTERTSIFSRMLFNFRQFKNKQKIHSDFVIMYDYAITTFTK